MNDVSVALPHPPSESLQEALAGRLASVVHIMKGRWSLWSELGVLVLNDGALSLHGANGVSLFTVEAEGVQGRPHPRRLALHQRYFRIRAADRWWYLAPHVVPTRYQRCSTRELVERYAVRERAPRPIGMNEATYVQRVKNPSMHGVVWARCWLQVLNMPNQHVGSS